jgi:hypothetical protein
MNYFLYFYISIVILVRSILESRIIVSRTLSRRMKRKKFCAVGHFDDCSEKSSTCTSPRLRPPKPRTQTLNTLVIGVKMVNNILLERTTLQSNHNCPKSWCWSEDCDRHNQEIHENDFCSCVGSYWSLWKTKRYFFEENLNSDVYIKILKSRLKESQITYTRQGFEWKFLQDGHRAHTSKKSTFFEVCALGRSFGCTSSDVARSQSYWRYVVISWPQSKGSKSY